jgi:hypothetical protein
MKTSIACLALAAGATAQVQQFVTPYWGRAPAMMGFGGRGMVGQPYFAPRAPAVPAVPLTEEEQAAASKLAEEQVAALRADWATSQAAALAAAAAATRAEMNSEATYYKWLSGNMGDNLNFDGFEEDDNGDRLVDGNGDGIKEFGDNRKRFRQRQQQILWEIANTDANKALAAFNANPSRATSLASEAASANANLKLMGVFAGSGADDGSFGRAGQYAFVGESASMEIAEDALKAAERQLGFNDDSSAYFAALSDFDSAQDSLWQQTLNMQGKGGATTHMGRANFFNSYQSAWEKYASSSQDRAALASMEPSEASFLDSWWPIVRSGYDGVQYDYIRGDQNARRARAAADAILPAFVERNSGFNVQALQQFMGGR